MNNVLTQKEIDGIVSAKSNAGVNTVKRVWGNFIELIISELQNNGSVKIQNFGRFDLIERGGGDTWVENEYGVKELRYIDFHYDVDFTPSENFIKYITGEIVSKWTKRALGEEYTSDLLVNRTRGKYKYNKSDLPICENMTDKILTLVQINADEATEKAERKAQKERESVEKNRELMNKRKPKRVRCLNNDVTYKSWNECARQLNIRTAKLAGLLNRAEGKIVKCDEYTFEKIDD